VRVRTLGGFAVTDGGRDVTPTGLPAEALKLVAVHGGRLHWEEVAEALWPAAPPERGRTRLRNVLSRLRTETGAVVARRGVLVQLAPDVQVDAIDFDRAARDVLTVAARDPAAAIASARTVLELYGGDLLPEDRYASWTAEPRERLRRRFLAIVDLLVQDAQRNGDPEGALLLLERAIEVEPDAEDPYLDAAELLAALGRRSASLRMVLRARRLAEEAHLPPSERCRALEAALRAAAPGPQATRDGTSGAGA
jgi:DNA-binding SARP family transcriptional activator